MMETREAVWDILDAQDVTTTQDIREPEVTRGDGDIWLPGFCGNKSEYDAFISLNLSWNTHLPDVTDCFRYTIIDWAPCLLLLISAPFYFWSIHSRQRDRYFLRRSGLNVAKIVIGSLLAGLSGLEMLLGFHQTSKYDARPVAVISPLVVTLTLVLAVILAAKEHKKGIHTSGVLWLFWLTKLLLDIVPVYSFGVRYSQDQVNGVRLFLSVIRLSLDLIQFLLTSCADHGVRMQFDSKMSEYMPLVFTLDRPDTENKCPEETVNFYSDVTFSWLTSYLIKGWRKAMTFGQLPNLCEDEQCRRLMDEFDGYAETEGLYVEKDYYRMHWKLIKCLTKTTGWLYVKGALARLVCIGLILLNPLVLKYLVSFIDSADPYTWKGMMYAAMLLIINTLNAVIIHQWLHAQIKTGMRVRTITNALIYKKSLKLSSTGKRDTTVGEIVNLMSVDAQKLQDGVTLLNMIWDPALLTILTVIMLWNEVGLASLAGLGVLILIVPLNGLVLGRSISSLQRGQMVEKDQRVRCLGEVLSGIKVLKFYAWETSFLSRLLGFRDKELEYLKSAGYINGVGSISWFLAPYLTTLAIFGCYVMLSPDNYLTPEIAFVCLSLVNNLNFPLSLLPNAVSNIAQGIASYSRTVKFLILDEIEKIQSLNVKDDDLYLNNSFTSGSSDARVTKSYVGGITNEVIRMTRCTTSWDNEVPSLRNINLSVPSGGLYAVIGTVGSGKSSLIQAILGEMKTLQGDISVEGKIAYVPQQAWIQNCTLRDNILFGQGFRNHMYQKVLKACALEADLKSLPGGDQTEIGEKGINLSGGQKQRVSLARAVYQDTDIYLLDDPLSAVDAHVGKHIFKHVVGPRGVLKNKTRILVTHNLAVLNQVDQVIVMKDGRISETGSYQQLIEKEGDFSQYLEQISMSKISSAATVSEESSYQSGLSDGEGWSTTGRVHKRKIRRSSTTSSILESYTEEFPEKDDLIKEEYAEVGTIQWSVIWNYVKAGGLTAFIFTILGNVLFIAAQVWTNIWLSQWTNEPVVNGTRERSVMKYRLGVYGILGIVQVILVMVGALAVAIGCVRASRILHSQLLNRILRAPMSFFDTTPLGRIMNRFSKDLDIADTNMPLYIRAYLFAISPFASTIIVIVYTIPIFMALVVPVGVIYYFTQKIYISNVRQLKRIDSIQRSPIFAHFDESITGASSIRAYRRQTDFTDKCEVLIDNSQRAWYLYNTAMRWMGVWMEVMGAVITFLASVFAVAQRDSLSAGMAGLCITYALQVTLFINITIRNASELETFIVAVERIEEYSNVDMEPEWERPSRKPPVTWPDSGEVVFASYGTRYRPGLDLVLKHIDCHIRPGEKVGIVGRTGAGKSSLTLALFRIIEAAQGQICIDGTDISVLGLHDLRSKLTIIPQDPVLFSGSLKFNLDPFGVYTDDEVYSSLEQAHLSAFVRSQHNGVHYQVGENGEALSIGQRQLVCLARALLRRTKILILDEATAAIDIGTDELIQQTIRDRFVTCTVLTIAHRINTVLDYDRILVLDQGRVVEFDSPSALLQNKASVFCSMTKEAGLM